MCCVQTHRTQLASGNPSGRAEWNFRCCFALELPNVYDDIKVRTLHCHASSLLFVLGLVKPNILWQGQITAPKDCSDCIYFSVVHALAFRECNAVVLGAFL